MPGANLELKIHKKATHYLLSLFKSKHPGFNAEEIASIMQEIQALVRRDELLSFVHSELAQKSNFDMGYLSVLIDSLFNPDFLARLYANFEFYPLKNGRNNDELYTVISEFIEENTIEQDLRLQNDDDRLLRRLDSLGRVLSISIANSACVAVSIHQGQLVVASNVGGRSTAEEVTTALTKKIAVLKELARLCPSERFEDIYAFCCQDENSDKVLAILGSGVTLSTLTQSLAKIIHVLKTDDYPFCAEFRHALDDEQSIHILTAEKINQELCVRVTELNSTMDSVQFMELPKYMDKSTLQKDLHAEQLIKLHYDNALRSEPITGLIRVGISKLCCHTCYHVFKDDARYLVRGTHNNSYKGTSNLFTGARTEQNSNYYGSCNPVDSALYSPSKRSFLMEKFCSVVDPTQLTDESGLDCHFEEIERRPSPAQTEPTRDEQILTDWYKFFKSSTESLELAKEALDPDDPMDLSDFHMFD